MPVSAPAERGRSAANPAEDESRIPSMQRASGAPAATCRECKVVVRFMRGFEPVLVGWADGICPSCQRYQTAQLAREEQEAAVLDELRRDPDLTIADLERLTGSLFSRPVRKEAVEMGIATPLGQLGQRGPAEEHEHGKRRASSSSAAETATAIRDVIAAHPNCDVVELVDALGISDTTIRRHLRVLVESGDVEAAGAGRRGKPVTYGSRRESPCRRRLAAEQAHLRNL